MLRYQILGQSNHAVAILLDLLKQVHRDPIAVDIVSNIPPEENDSLAYGYDTDGVETREIPHTNWQRDPDAHLLIGSIGRSREHIFGFFQERFGIEAESYENAIHPQACLPLEMALGHGVHVGPGATIAPHAEIGDLVVVNRNTSVGHHSVLEDFVTLNPGSQVAGICRLEHGVTIGTGASLVDSITIGRNSVIGAGSVVTRDIPPDVVAYGVPAKVVRGR
jgi:sugar O-acyltransferase (sialic acid O-acetyltransferase NeuD family)